MRAGNCVGSWVANEQAYRSRQRRVAERAQIGAQIELVAGDQRVIGQCRPQFEATAVIGEERRIGWYPDRALGQADLHDDEQRQQKKQREPRKRQADQHHTTESSQSGHCIKTTPSSGGQVAQTTVPRSKEPAAVPDRYALSDLPCCVARWTIVPP